MLRGVAQSGTGTVSTFVDANLGDVWVANRSRPDGTNPGGAKGPLSIDDRIYPGEIDGP